MHSATYLTTDHHDHHDRDDQIHHYAANIDRVHCWHHHDASRSERDQRLIVCDDQWRRIGRNQSVVVRIHSAGRSEHRRSDTKGQCTTATTRQ
jgi:hypothetical protein